MLTREQMTECPHCESDEGYYEKQSMSGNGTGICDW